MQVAPLVEDFDVMLKFVEFVGRQRQVVLPCHIDERLRADCPFQMAMDLDLRKVVVLGIEILHLRAPRLNAGYSTVLRGAERRDASGRGRGA